MRDLDLTFFKSGHVRSMHVSCTLPLLNNLVAPLGRMQVEERRREDRQAAPLLLLADGHGLEDGAHQAGDEGGRAQHDERVDVLRGLGAALDLGEQADERGAHHAAHVAQRVDDGD